MAVPAAAAAAWSVQIDHQDDNAMIFPSFNYYCFSLLMWPHSYTCILNVVLPTMEQVSGL